MIPNTHGVIMYTGSALSYAETQACRADRINDSYEQKSTIKDNERKLRQKGTLISNIYTKSEDKCQSIK